jgi:mannose/fructose/N-acetylgalactosamine-specific phosphotransferase system component IID
MTRHSLVASFGLVAGLTAALSAQARASNGNVNERTIQSIRIKVIGCVAGGTETGHYRLTPPSR